jgi:hypothetical protein
MALLVLTLVFLGLSVGVGVWASHLGRSHLKWFLLATLVSPPIAALILLIVGRRRDSEDQVS